MRLLTMIIMKRLDEQYKYVVHDSQNGFVGGKSCDDALWILTEAIKTPKKPFYVAFIDLKSAYDKVPRNLLFKVLNIYFNNSKLIRILELIYTNTESNIKITDMFFSTKSGYRQRGIESPPFFNCYFDWVMTKIFYSINIESQPTNYIGNNAHYESDVRKCGIQIDYYILSECTGDRSQRNQIIGSCNVDIILFADDGAILFDSKDHPADGLECADNVFTQYVLTLAVGN